MRHVNPKIQDIIETLHGALTALGARDVAWRPVENWDSYNIRFIVMNLNSKGQQYSAAFGISRRTLEDPIFANARNWDGFKWNLVRAVVNKVIEDVGPATADQIRYMADPRVAISNADGEAWSAVGVVRIDEALR